MGDRIARLASIAAVLGLGAVGLALPGSLLFGGAAWLAFVLFALSGWGGFVVRIARTGDVDLGLRAVWGLAGYLAVAGVLVLVGICSRPAILVLAAVGFAGFAWRELTTAEPVVEHVRRGLAAARARPAVAVLVGANTVLVVLRVLGALAHLDRSPWDDDIAYTPFVRRLLDAGDLVEPFSFRRLASFGGQTALQALVGARGSIASVHAWDQGLCFALVMLLVVGHARTLRTPGFWLAVVALVLVTVPDISINTASYWSGAVCFLALYRTVATGDLMLAALVGAATCTFRHNYIPVVALLLLVSELSSWRRTGEVTWRRWGRAMAVAVGVALPWMIASVVSSHTFMFPLVKGTWNQALSLGPSGWTWVDELSLFVTTALDCQPVVVALLLVPLAAFAHDSRPHRPLTALLLASVLGFAALVHGFNDADAASMWRYAFGFMTPLFVVLALEGADAAEGAAAPVTLPVLGRWVLLAALLLQIVTSRSELTSRLGTDVTNMKEAVAIGRHGDPSVEVERRRHAALQAAIPAGARMLVMLDDPAYLDFARNEIANLDVPGFASPGPQLPAFQGAEEVRAYLLDQGYRYVAFVRSDRSRYAFRRGFWVWRLFNDTEFFQAMSAYSIDMIDSLAELTSSSTVLYDAGGLVALDLDKPHEHSRGLAVAGERGRRDAFIHDIAVHEGFAREWALSTRRGLVFGDGLSGLTFAQGDAFAHWFDFFIRDPKPTRGVPVRWMYRRAHLRLHAATDMHLVLRGHVNLNLLYTRPRLDVSLDGRPVASVVVDEDGGFVIDAVLPAATLADWSDLYVVFNAIGQPERDAREVRIARLEDVTWEPR
jgi:hypothetical protein